MHVCSGHFKGKRKSSTFSSLMQVFLMSKSLVSVFPIVNLMEIMSGNNVMAKYMHACVLRHAFLAFITYAYKSIPFKGGRQSPAFSSLVKVFLIAKRFAQGFPTANLRDLMNGTNVH